MKSILIVTLSPCQLITQLTYRRDYALMDIADDKFLGEGGTNSMALHKEDFHDDDKKQEINTMKRSRITIDISPELRRRIKVAASQRDLSISEYLGNILEQSVPDEASIRQTGRPVTQETLERLRRIREKILQDRRGKLLEDSTEIIRKMREERTQELEQL
jgi:predicted DNA binding CopG/RHH family protein